MQQSGSLKSAVFLDRDGVINQALIRRGRPYSPRRRAEVIILDGVKESVSSLFSHNFEIVVVTNQPDVSRGIISESDLEEIHKFVAQETGIKHFYTCVHEDRSCCDCRKPKTGMLKRAAEDLSIDLKNSFLVGDRWRDIQAGQEIGCSCYFIDYNYQERRPNLPYFQVESLREATKKILEKK